MPWRKDTAAEAGHRHFPSRFRAAFGAVRPRPSPDSAIGDAPGKAGFVDFIATLAGAGRPDFQRDDVRYRAGRAPYGVPTVAKTQGCSVVAAADGGTSLLDPGVA